MEIEDRTENQQEEQNPQPAPPKYGARVYAHPDGVINVKQTIKRGTDPRSRFVVDGDRERFIDPGDDAALGAAVREATQGRF